MTTLDVTATHPGGSVKAAVGIAVAFLADLVAFAADPVEPAQSEPWPEIRVVSTRIERCVLRFKSVRGLPHGVLAYRINICSLNRTFFFKLGDIHEGVEVLRYIPKIETREVDGVLKYEDNSILEIRFRGEILRLEKGRVVPCDTPHALLRIPAADWENEVSEGDRIEVDGRGIIVRRIEPSWGGVCLVDEASGARRWLCSHARLGEAPRIPVSPDRAPADGTLAIPQPDGSTRIERRVGERSGPAAAGPACAGIVTDSAPKRAGRDVGQRGRRGRGLSPQEGAARGGRSG